MKPFTIKQELQEGIEALLSDLGIDSSTFNQQIDKYFDPEDLSENLKRWLDNSPASAPLLALIDGLEEDALKYEQTAQVAKEFAQRLTAYEDEDINDLAENIYHNTSENNDIKHILCGAYVIQILQDQLLRIDFLDYGFLDAKQMLYVLGAYISNALHFNDPREIEVTTKDSSYLNVYTHDTHGDFRLYQYDLSEHSMLNPFNSDEILPFGKPKVIGGIAGYHSVEPSFLIGLLCFIHHNNIHCGSLVNFDNYIEKLKAKGQIFGNFADAGMSSSSSTEFHFFGFDTGTPVNIYTACKSFYQPKLESGGMTYYLMSDSEDQNPKKIISITPGMIEGLFTGLFEKVAVGNGRSSIKELEEVVRYYENKYASKAA